MSSSPFAGVLQRPFFAAAVTLTLSLGIGASTAVFTLVHAVLLRPVPFPESERLVAVKTVSTVGVGAVWEAPLHDVNDGVIGSTPAVDPYRGRIYNRRRNR